MEKSLCNGDNDKKAQRNMAFSSKYKCSCYFGLNNAKRKKCVCQCRNKPNGRALHKLQIRFAGPGNSHNIHRFKLKDIRVETVTRRIMAFEHNQQKNTRRKRKIKNTNGEKEFLS